LSKADLEVASSRESGTVYRFPVVTGWTRGLS